MHGVAEKQRSKATEGASRLKEMLECSLRTVTSWCLGLTAGFIYRYIYMYNVDLLLYASLLEILRPLFPLLELQSAEDMLGLLACMMYSVRGCLDIETRDAKS